MFKWTLLQVFGDIIRWAVYVFLSAVCLMFGFAPEKFLNDVIGAVWASPPDWLSHPITRIGVNVVGLFMIGVVMLVQHRQKRSTPTQKHIKKETRKPTVKIGADSHHQSDAQHEQAQKIDAFADLQNAEARLNELERLAKAEADTWETMQEEYDDAPDRFRILSNEDPTITHPYTLTRATYELWQNTLDEIVTLHRDVLDERLNLKDDPRFDRFLHLKAKNEPEGLDQKLQDEYRRYATIHDDVQGVVKKIRDALARQKGSAEAVLGIERGQR